MDDSERAHAREILLTAAAIVDPIPEHHFRGTMREATDVLVAYAAGMRVRHDVRAMGAMTRHFVNSQPEEDRGNARCRTLAPGRAVFAGRSVAKVTIAGSGFTSPPMH